MEVEINPELEQKMRAWAESEPKMKRFLKNLPLIRKMYMRHHVSKTIPDCMEGCRVELTVMTISTNKRKATTMCKDCSKTTCSCGTENYKDRRARSWNVADVNYTGMDDDEAVIQVTYPPFEDDEALYPSLEEGKCYKIAGMYDTFKGKASIRPTDVEEVDVEDVGEEPTAALEDAIKAAKSMLKLGNGKVKSAKWKVVMGDYKEHLPEVVKALDIVEIDGEMQRG